MNVKFGKLAVLGAALAVSAAFTAPANAQFTITGSMWQIPAFQNVPAAGSAVYSTPASATFTLSNTAANNLFDFNSGNCATCYNLSAFLTSGSPADVLTYMTGAGLANTPLDTPASCSTSTCVTDDLFQFTGSVTLVNGVTYNFEHDDGLLLYLGGIATPVINVPGPTSAEATPFSVCASGCNAVGGTYTFTLDYAEVDGAPAVLITNIPLTSTPTITPEPSSLMLLGTGLVSAAGVFMRKRRTA